MRWIVGVAVLLGLVLSPPAAADGLPVTGVEADRSRTAGQRIPYTATVDGRDTIVERIDRHTGQILGVSVVRGRFSIPVVAYDGSAAGLSANGRVLVLITPRPGFPRRNTTFAVLETQHLNLRKRLTLRGDYSFDALSPDGRWLYLIHYTSRTDALKYEVVALDLRTGNVASEPIVDPREPDEQMNGHPLTRATSSEGRWAYTLYEGAEHPFVHALDTARRDARCIDLDWLTGRKGLRALRFALRADDRDLILRTPKGDAVAVVDTDTFEAARPSSAGLVSWPKTALSSLALLVVVVGLIFLVRARMRYEPTS
jgi:hypothetical protein